MAGLVRLDKFLADMGTGTRSEVKLHIKKGKVTVNGEIEKSADRKIDVSRDRVAFDGSELIYAAMEYYMLHKPAGVVSATTDNLHTTVLDLIQEGMKREHFMKKELFPVGRLDKDTEGLLLITNDGELAHKLLSPKKHISKLYYAKVKGRVTAEDVNIFKTGIKLEEDFTTLPARLNILKADDVSEVEITIYEGKFHQIKRMFEAVKKEVIYLKRLQMGELVLDNSLKKGEYRKLTEAELKKLKG
ncbi:pseudouridine synthase [Anaerocolumna cellulosilytica]|uniref:Pseudouridine synthase n=1 Tax=Anaerocolumna cellulosilytica TaxID=433286 RepID=A0A6S6R1I6_9FIRM|nr:pseudouridine synthase [Anaerocolumna cellulosilytica]MBB5196985.1 16S rRNA pseudouridine516 synthase [Anaerocolumna cellulosilytica]BCJ95199.1 pseudouridine synthase [Anaerocolumna cellulosilytica]